MRASEQVLRISPKEVRPSLGTARLGRAEACIDGDWAIMRLVQAPVSIRARIENPFQAILHENAVITRNVRLVEEVEGSIPLGRVVVERFHGKRGNLVVIKKRD